MISKKHIEVSGVYDLVEYRFKFNKKYLLDLFFIDKLDRSLHNMSEANFISTIKKYINNDIIKNINNHKNKKNDK